MKIVRQIGQLRAICAAVGLAGLVAALAIAAPPARAAGYLGESRSSYDVFVFGDSLAAGLGAGLQRMLDQGSRLSLTGRFRANSGLARPRLYDWVRALPRTLERNDVDIAIMFIGMNDARPLRRDDERIPFGTPEWIDAYAERVGEVVRILKQQGVAIYWMGLPPMANPEHDEAVELISSIHEQIMSAAGVRYIPLRSEWAAEDGSYTDSGNDLNGRFRRLRQHDGVHFLRAGNDKMARAVLDLIAKDIAVADGELAPDEAPVDGGVVLSDGRVVPMPVFGQEQADGTAQLALPRELPQVASAPVTSERPEGPRAAASLPARLTPGQSLMSSLRDTAPIGSTAEELFTTGTWPQGPAGRPDDFAWPGTADSDGTASESDR